MSSRGRVLLADDEETFAEATADLLRREGYECDAVFDGPSALERLQQEPYDLIISDLEMPGNEELGLIRQVAAEASGLPIIIVTGFPSTRSAIASIELPVAAYLLKPVQLPLLLDRVGSAINRFKSLQAMRAAEERVRSWRAEFNRMVEEQQSAQGDRQETGSDGFLALTLRNLVASLSDLQRLGVALAAPELAQHLCTLLGCPRGADLEQAARQALAVLESAKDRLSSPTIRELRHRLEQLLEYH
jgi:DNA-binding response OmpR family regulator